MMDRKKLCTLFLMGALITPHLSHTKEKNTKPIPRFASLKSSESNFRIGPSVNYPIKWVYIKKGMPMEIISEFANWRKVRDIEGDVGWVHHSLLSGKRKAIIVGGENQPLFTSTTNNHIKAFLEPGLIVKIEECDIAFCKVDMESYNGYVAKQSLWGVYEEETIN